MSRKRISPAMVLVLRATDGEESSSLEARPALTPTERILENEKLGTAERAIVEAAAAKRTAAENGETKNKYPLDVPSPILLGTSIILAIASTGTYFLLYLYVRMLAEGQGHSSHHTDHSFHVGGVNWY